MKQIKKNNAKAYVHSHNGTLSLKDKMIFCKNKMIFLIQKSRNLLSLNKWKKKIIKNSIYKLSTSFRTKTRQ